MSILAGLSDEQMTLVVSMPYRTGMWMSHADDEDGGVDDAREMKALEASLRKVSTSKTIPVFVVEVVRETLVRRAEWDKWAENTFDIVPDARRAMEVVSTKVSRKDSVNYGRLLLTIAKAVAGAHGEFGDDLDDDQKGIKAFIMKLLGHSQKREDFMNVSPTEQAAIDRLVAAIRVSKD